MSSKPDLTKWSPKEILGHLIDSAYNNHQRFARANHQENFIFQGYDQVDWVKLNNYQNRTTSEIIDTWSTVNYHLVQLIDNIDDETLKRKTTDHNFHQICMNTLSEGEESSLSYLIWDYIYHIEHHLAQIINNYERILPPYSK